MDFTKQTLQEKNENGELINITNIFLNSYAEFYTNAAKKINEFNNLNVKILAKYQDNSFAQVNIKMGAFKSIIDKRIYIAYYIEENTERLYLFNVTDIVYLLNFGVLETSAMYIDKKRLLLNYFDDWSFSFSNIDVSKFDEKFLIRKNYILGIEPLYDYPEGIPQ